MEKIEERRYPTWDNDLIMCPSQCYCYFEADGKKYCIYLRWRWDDPWTAQIVPVDDICEFLYGLEWEYLETKFYSHDNYEKLQEECIKIIKEKFNDVKWLVKEYYGYGC